MEEKGGVIHIIFFFIGIACISLGIFYLLTDEKIKLDEYDDKIVIIVDDDPNANTDNGNTEDDNNRNKPKESNINQISIIENMETTVTLKNGNSVKLLYKVDTNTETQEVIEKAFLYNERKVFDISSQESCSKYFLYNDSIVVHCDSGLYIVDSKGLPQKFETFTGKYNEDLGISSVNIRDDKLIVSGTYLLVDSQIVKNNKVISLCDPTALTENEIADDYPIDEEYELSIEDKSIKFSRVKTTKTVGEYVKENCKVVE